MEKIKRINCCIRGLEPYGLFVGMKLALKNMSDFKLLEKEKKSLKFYNEVLEEPELFLETHHFSVKTVSNWFKKSIGFTKNASTYPKVISPPNDYLDCVWFDDIRHLNCKENIAEVCLITNMNYKHIWKGSNDLIRVSDLANTLYFFGIHSDYQILNLKRLAYLENKYEFNLRICRLNDGDHQTRHSLVIPLRDKLVKKHSLTIDIVVDRKKLPESVHEEINNFDIVISNKYRVRLMTCDVVKKCKYSTYDEPNFKKHIAICAEISLKQTKCVQKDYGDDSTTLKSMVEEDILPIKALYYRNYIHCTFDVETIEEKNLNCVPNRGTVTDA